MSTQGLAEAKLGSSLQVTITVEREPTSASSYYWAQQFMPESTVDHGGYFGLQTGGVIGNRVVGKMLIFSIWNALAAEAGPGAVAQTFGGEGVGYSVRLAYEWQENVPYTFTLRRQSADPLWWELRFSAPGVEPTYLGRIQVTAPIYLGYWLPQFTEYFRQLPSCDALPPARTTFSQLLFDGVYVPARDPHPYGPCADWARASVVNGTAVHETGISPAAP